MALITDYPYNDNPNLIHHYSDAGFTVLQTDTGIEYGDAIDKYPTEHTYIETDHQIDPEEETENE